MTLQNINNNLEVSVVNLQLALDEIEFAEKNERFTAEEVLEIETRLTLLNTYLARCDKSIGELKRNPKTKI